MRRALIALLGVLLLLAVPAAATAKPADRNRNAIPDRWERANGLSVKKDQAKRDSDRDGLNAWAEWRSKTNPRKRDSDRDGRADGREDRDRDRLANAAEMRFGYDPGKRDSDRDGTRDGDENAGVIKSVAGDLVTIDLARGGTLAARLGDGTDLGCDSEADDAYGEDEAGGDDDADLGEEVGEDGVEEEYTEEDADASGDEGEDSEEAVAGAASVQPGDEEDAEDAEDDAPSADCLPTLRPGTLVHSAEVERDGSALHFVALELLAK